MMAYLALHSTYRAVTLTAYVFKFHTSICLSLLCTVPPPALFPVRHPAVQLTRQAVFHQGHCCQVTSCAAEAGSGVDVG